MKKYGLVFSGGGTRGSYQIGAWKALRELGFEFNATAGTSIGAVNGALFAQGDFDLAYNAWTDLDMSDFTDLKEKSSMSLFVHSILNGGLDVSLIKKILSKFIDEDKIRKSPIDYGLVTFSVTDMKPVILSKDDIPKGKLLDYIVASATHPMFKLKEIDGVQYIDGGVYDNMPIELIAKKGVKDIICIDISSVFGRRRQFDKQDLNLDTLTIVKHSGYLGKILDFNLSLARKNIEMGYLDTIRTFGNLKGKNYYFNNINFNEDSLMYPLEDRELLKMLDSLEVGSYSSTRSARFSMMRKLYKYCDGKLNMKTILPACLEITAEIFEIERIKTYTQDELLSIILIEYEKILENFRNSNDKNTVIGKLNALEFHNINKKNLLVYLVSLRNNNFTNKKLLIQFLPKIFIAYTFLNLINERKSKTTALA